MIVVATAFVELLAFAAIGWYLLDTFKDYDETTQLVIREQRKKIDALELDLRALRTRVRILHRLDDEK